MQLTPHQIARFDTFGFLHLAGAIADRIDGVIGAFDRLWHSCGGGHDGRRHDFRQRSCLAAFIDRDAELCTLLDDPRIDAIASGLLGEDFNYMGSDGNYYSGDTHWHADGAHRGIRHIKIAIYLDPLTPETGALRVIPGSHRLDDRYAQDLRAGLAEGRFGIGGDLLPAWSATIRPGDLLVFDHNILHSAWGGGTQRRMFTLNLCQRYPADRLGELQDYLATAARFVLTPEVSAPMRETAGPKRRRHLEQPAANTAKLVAEVARLQAAGQVPARG